DRVIVLNKGEIIAEGTPEEIKASSGGKRIRCQTSLSLATVRSFAGVVDVQEDRGTLEIRTARPEPVLRELLARDTEISGIEVTSAGLEEAFLSLTRQN